VASGDGGDAGEHKHKCAEDESPPARESHSPNGAMVTFADEPADREKYEGEGGEESE
jgi:hypothetical protein